MNTLGSRLKELRKKNKLRQQDIAEKANITGGYFSEIENDKRQPAVDTLQAIAAALSTTTGYLLGETDNPSPNPNLEEMENDPEIEVLKRIASDPRKYAAAALLDGMDENQLRKAYEYLSDQKQLGTLLKEKGA
jgi:Predicted transcriptional regulators